MRQSFTIIAEPADFFRDRVVDAMSNQNIKVDDHVEFYLVNLLCEFITPARLETATGNKADPLNTPLALILKEAVEAPPPRRLRIFKALGDTSLYVSGFFQDYFNRKTFDIGYYITLGRTAYVNVSNILQDHNNEQGFSSLYSDLADNFQLLVDVVAEVSETPDKGSTDLLALYDRWNRCNSARLRKILESYGITPVPISKAEQ